MDHDAILHFFLGDGLMVKGCTNQLAPKPEKLATEFSPGIMICPSPPERKPGGPLQKMVPGRSLGFSRARRPEGTKKKDRLERPAGWGDGVLRLIFADNLVYMSFRLQAEVVDHPEVEDESEEFG